MPDVDLNQRIRVALVEDDVNLQAAMAAAVAGASDMRLLWVSANRADGLRALADLPADVLLVDLGLPDGSGIDVIRAAVASHPGCGVMVCTTFADEVHVLQSIEAGASGYLLKDGSAGDMLAEIRSLHGGGSPISPLIARQILTRFRMAPPPEPKAPPPSPPAPVTLSAPAADGPTMLSRREQEVLELTTKGFTADEIAKLMNVSHHTVQTYVRRIYSKLKVRSKAEAIYEARNQGLLKG